MCYHICLCAVVIRSLTVRNFQTRYLPSPIPNMSTPNTKAKNHQYITTGTVQQYQLLYHRRQPLQSHSSSHSSSHPPFLCNPSHAGGRTGA